MRKYYTIEKTLHCNRKSLEEMIRCCVGNRKNPSCDICNTIEQPKKKKFSAGKNSQKKIARRANI